MTRPRPTKPGDRGHAKAALVTAKAAMNSLGIDKNLRLMQCMIDDTVR